jgi:hypothetical protein
MAPQEIERLRRQWTGRTVAVDTQRPELRRWTGCKGWVITVNYNGRALVQFDGPDKAWHDIHPDYLKPIEEQPLE